ncbi:ABC transporter ATP-binding protein [SCandidatus Aminicenantes bacterium Aminicenantia_JdfR_composite]|jgi:oligopeptide/dipeptide ABC transporter ATP-binding protein|nr:ABC transporter ATP-binding protein [SCandidatus Aminicenantes bacterium Aminicenantia_JdfR_composite]MCP2605696.1 ABC transporter ATP-binding protein [Candidatus Aminicenantes bacterium AC-335-O07]MCP2606574.1 ABC transporter ATP-binding protein [Candidatus Aminicenantes bacterium AC-708-I09]
MQFPSLNSLNPKAEKTILLVRNLKTYFYLKEGILKAVNDVSFSLKSNEIFALVGESGSGKTVLSLSLIRLLPERARIVGGEIIFNNKNLVKLKEKEITGIRGRKISMIFQEPMTALNPVMTIGEQIIETIRFHFHLNRKEAFKEMISLLKKVKFPEPEKRYKSYPHQLSGGMRQRALIAIALAGRPEILIADEPTTALDVITEGEIIELLLNLKEEMNLSLIFISHDISLVSSLADKIGVMYAGQLVEFGRREHVMNQPKHPYTIALWNSLPAYWERRKVKIKTIPGLVPNLLNPPQGCTFHPRCLMKKRICSIEEPPQIKLNDGIVKCWLY